MNRSPSVMERWICCHVLLLVVVSTTRCKGLDEPAAFNVLRGLVIPCLDAGAECHADEECDYGLLFYKNTCELEEMDHLSCGMCKTASHLLHSNPIGHQYLQCDCIGHSDCISMKQLAGKCLSGFQDQ